MEKEELLNKIAEAFGAGNKEVKIAYDAFLQKISEELSPDEAVKIPDFGVFQIKPKTVNESFDLSPDNSGNPPYRLLYFPDNSNDVVELDFSFSGTSKKNSPESAFSLSAGKPIIPILESQKKELMIQSSYINLLNDFKEKADLIFGDAVKLDNFNIEGAAESKPDIFIHSDDLSVDDVIEPGEKDETIPWNFGDVLNSELERQELNSEPEPADASEDLTLETQSIDEHAPGEVDLSVPEQPDEELEVPEIENNADENLQNSDNEIDINNLGDDFFNLSASDLGLEDENKNEIVQEETEQPADLSEMIIDEENAETLDGAEPEQSENDEESADDESYEEDGSGEEEEDTEEDQKNQEEVISIDVNKAHEFSSSRNIPLEEVESPDDVDVQYSKWFWIVLVALVFITAGGIYYFFFNKSASENNNKNQASAKIHKVQPQVVERDYEVPVSVIPKSKDDAADKSVENTASNSNNGSAYNAASNNTAANTQAKPENTKPEKAAPEKTAPEKTAQQKTVDSKTLANAAKKGNEKEQKNKPAPDNVKPVQQQETPKQVISGTSTPSSSSLERKDNKNTLVKNYIFSDGKKYTIQLSSWKSREIAEKEVKRLKKQGLDAYFTESYVPSVGGTWYRVRVGEFYTIQGAEDALEKIK